MLLPWVTQVIAQVSPHTQDNDVRLKMTPLKGDLEFIEAVSMAESSKYKY